jgi:NADH-ubiquinone oxidoreductase chain 3
MNSITFFFLLVCVIAILFLVLNLALAPHNNYNEKISAFECGFHSFLQTRTPFNISFFVYGILFLLFDLEILLLFPFAVSAYVNSLYGLIIVLIFSTLLTVGFVFEIGKGALQISSRQNNSPLKNSFKIMELIGRSSDRPRNYSSLASPSDEDSSSDSPV